MTQTRWPSVADDPILSDHQKERAAQATRHRFGILNGSPGTGKTTTAAAIMRKVVEQYGRDTLCVACPTGKAAVRINQSLRNNGVPVAASTIHRLLMIGPGFEQSGETGSFNEFNPLPFDFIVIDEGSMIDTALMAALMRAIGDNTHVLIIGDIGQLPPVGHGAPLRDLIAAGVPCGELTEIRRNAGLIVRACAAIKDGKRFETAERYDPEAGANLRHFETIDDDETLASVEELLLRFREVGTFDPVWQTQILVAVNDRGECSRKLVNDRLQKLLNTDGRRVGANPFAIGDKVICLKNGKYSRVREPGDPDADKSDPVSYRAQRMMIPGGGMGGPEEHYVANGEIGRVVAVNANVFIARFSEDDALVKVVVGKKKEADNGDSTNRSAGNNAGEGDGADKGRGCNFDLAYAITCHKAQGSEAPCVIVIIDEAGGRVAGREWVYTAISRASKLCVTIGRRAVLEKQAKRVTLQGRKTFLAELVSEAANPVNIKG